MATVYKSFAKNIQTVVATFRERSSNMKSERYLYLHAYLFIILLKPINIYIYTEVIICIDR